MKFRTELETRAASSPLDPEKPIVLIGSCFTDYIGERMRQCRWRAYPNLTGTLFNPSSIARILNIATLWTNVSEEIEASLARRDKLWISWLADSGCSTYSKEETGDRVFQRLLALRNHLKEAQALIVTFGTAWVYELAEAPCDLVANCHKFPSDTFVRRRLSVKEIAGQWSNLLSLLPMEFDDIRIIFTVSPVRHLKDGFEGNSRSKAILQLACEEICSRNENTDYFPSYEIMNDDLRDYRFYSSDMVHPSSEAVDYIWEKFQDRYLSKESKDLLAKGEKVTKRLHHRTVLHGTSELARYMASLQRSEAMKVYNDFIQAHPGMLCYDQNVDPE